ncbi:MAG: hypothetical protein HFE86_08200 [Clostridiales bacterium]|nr:hypothetical protein [Clostridiales bacterium]
MAYFKHNKGKTGERFLVSDGLQPAGGGGGPTPAPPITSWDRRRDQVRAPHALTLNELLGEKPDGSGEEAAPSNAGPRPANPLRSAETIPMETVSLERTRPAPPASVQPAAESLPSAPSSLYSRMMQAKEEPASVSPDEADLALKAFAAALPAEQAKRTSSQTPAESLRARTLAFTQEAGNPDRQPHRIPALDVGNVDDIIRRFEEKAHSRAVDLYGETPAAASPQSAVPIRTVPDSAVSSDWAKKKEEHRQSALYGDKADNRPVSARKEPPSYQAPSARPARPAQSVSPHPIEQAPEPLFDSPPVSPPAPAPTPTPPASPVESISTVRVTPVRKARRFTTPAADGETGVQRRDAQPLVVEVRELGGVNEQPVMTTAPTSALPQPPAEPAQSPRRSPAQAVPAAAQFSFADGGLTAADQVYKKPKASKPRPADEVEDRTEELSSFSNPQEKRSRPPEGELDPAAAFLQKPVRRGAPVRGNATGVKIAGNKTAGGQDGATIQFTLEDAPGRGASPKRSGRPADPYTAERRSKKNVVLFGNVEEENAPEEMPPQPEVYDDEEIDDYETTADAMSIRADLRNRSRRLKARAIPTLIITLLLFLLSTSLLDSFKVSNLTVYLIANISLVCLAALINLNIMRGLGSLFCMRPDMDTPAALSVVGVLAHSLIMLATGNAAAAPQLGALAAMALLFGGVGKMTLLGRIRRNFELAADDDEKRAVLLLDDPPLTGPLADGSVIGEALICARRRTVHPQNFLRHSYCADPYERAVLKVSLASFGLALAAGLIVSLAVNLPAGINLAAVLLCLACPPTTLLLSNLPLSSAGKRLNREGAVLTGYRAADDLSYANAIAFSADELFPNGMVKLYKMHLLSANPIDEAILLAASVARQARSPIFSIFRQMLDKSVRLPGCDNVTYKDGLGLMGWVGKTRVLIGSRDLLELHGVRTPSAEVDKKVRRGGGFPVYLAVDGQPSCLFVAGYEADPGIAYQLQRLSATGVTLLIDSADPNLTAKMLCDAFGLYGESIKLIPSVAVPLLEQATESVKKADAPAFYRGTVGGFAALLTAAIRLKSNVMAMTVLHIVGMCLGLALAAYFTFARSSGFLTALPLAVYQLVCTLLTCLVPLLHKA